MNKFRKIDLYPVLTQEFLPGIKLLDMLAAVLAGGVSIVQLREKQLPAAGLLDLACVFRKLTTRAGALLIINDRIDIALACKADGVHLGNSDLPLPAAKKIAPGLILGKSTHNTAEARAACNEGADYINIGPVFSTATKPFAETLGLKKVKEISAAVNIPYTVMGGIKAEHLGALAGIGAKKIAMISGLSATDIPEHIRTLRSRINS